MLAVIKTGGKQYIAEKGSVLDVEKIDKKEGERITIKDVLLFSDGSKIEVGQPLVKNAEVEAEVVSHYKGEKKVAFKYAPKKRYKVKKGSRQPYTKIRIIDIKL